MRDTSLLPRFSHHLPRSPRTPPRAQRRTEAERRPTTRGQSQTASEERSSPLCRGSVDREDDEATVRRPRPNRAVHAHAGTAATAVWDPREPSAQRARQATTTRGFEQCHQWARQLSRPAAAKAVWPPLSSDRTVMRDAASVRAPLMIGELGSARDPLCVPPKAQPPHALSTCYQTKRRVTFAESDRSRWLLT